MSTLRRKIFGDLRANTGAFFAVWLTIVLGLAFYGSTYPAGVGMADSVFATYDQLHYADFNARFEPIARDDILDAVAAIDGLAGFEGRLVTNAGLELQAPDRLTLRLLSVPQDAHPAVNDYLVEEGNELSGADQLLVLKSFADFHDIRPGDVLRVWINDQPHDLTVAGLVFAPEYLVAGESPIMPFPQPNTFGVGYARYETLVTMLDQEDMINDVALTLTGDADEEVVRAALESALEPCDLEFIHSRGQTASGGVIDANVKGNLSVAIFFSLMFLLIGGLVMAVLLARLMDAEKRRIGTMRALGLSRGEALRHYLAFPVIIGISGAVVGSLFGYLSSFLVAAYFIQTLAGGNLPTFVNVPQWGFILFGAVVTITLALLAGVIPTWRASGTDPGLALRPVVPKGMGAHGRIAFPGLPLSARQAARNILRVPARTINTLLGVLVGVMVILAASGTADTTLRLTEVQFNQGLQFDLRVLWSTFVPANSRQREVENLPGVSEAEMSLIGPVTVHYQEQALDTFAVSLDHETDFYVLETAAGETAFSRDDAVWIGHNLARVLDVGVGDTLGLEALGQTQEARVAGVVNQGIGSPVFVPATLMASWTPLGVRLANMALIRVEPESRDEARRALAALDGVIAVEDLALTTRDIHNYMSLWVNFSYIFQGFGYLLTLVVIFNTVSINLRERREELAIMRAMGSSIGEIVRIITWETMSVTIVSMILAVPLGWIALDWLIGNYNLDFFGMLNHIAPHSYLIAAGGVIAIVLLAEWINLRSIRKVDLGQLSKSLSS